MAWRLLQRLQQRIESCVGDLVGFVEDINLEPIACGSIPRGFAQLANFVDSAIGGSVNFDYVNRISGANLDAGIAHPAGLRNRLLRRAAVQSHCQNARDGSLPDAPMSAKNIAVGDSSLLDGVLERAGNVLLPDDFRELLRTVFSGENLVAHGRRIT